MAVNRTADEFIKRWRTVVAGLALYGVASDSERIKRATHAERALDLPNEVEALLRRMYEDLCADSRPLPVKPAATANGAAKQPEVKR